MKSSKRQRGMSVLMGLFLLVVVAFAGLVGLKLFPVYLESMKIDHAMKGVTEDASVAEQSRRDIAFGLVRRLDIDGVTLINEKNWKDFVDISFVKNKVTLTVDWRREIPLFGNLSLVADFHKEASNQP
jgi:hypothetical protein